MVDPERHSRWDRLPTGLLALVFIVFAWVAVYLIWQGLAIIVPG